MIPTISRPRLTGSRRQVRQGAPSTSWKRLVSEAARRSRGELDIYACGAVVLVVPGRLSAVMRGLDPRIQCVTLVVRHNRRYLGARIKFGRDGSVSRPRVSANAPPSSAESAVDLMEASCFRNGETVRGRSPPAAARWKRALDRLAVSEVFASMRSTARWVVLARRRNGGPVVRVLDAPLPRSRCARSSHP
jgi:hypothetical protein